MQKFKNLKKTFLEIHKRTAMFKFQGSSMNGVIWRDDTKSPTNMPLKIGNTYGFCGDAQKAAAPKNKVEFCQGSNGTIRSSLAT